MAYSSIIYELVITFTSEEPIPIKTPNEVVLSRYRVLAEGAFDNVDDMMRVDHRNILEDEIALKPDISEISAQVSRVNRSGVSSLKCW